MGVDAYLSLIGRGGGGGVRLLEAGRLLTFSAFRMSTYSRVGEAFSRRSRAKTGGSTNQCDARAKLSFCL